MSRLGVDRPLSTKLRWRGEMPASRATSSWLLRRRPRHSLSSSPKACDGVRDNAGPSSPTACARRRSVALTSEGSESRTRPTLHWALEGRASVSAARERTMKKTTFTVHTIETAPPASRERLRHVAESLGMVPNLAAAMAESPTLLRAFFAVRDVYGQGTLSPVEIHVLSLVNAFENGCEWCMAFHSAAALKEELSREDLDQLRAGAAPAAPRLRALTRLARTMIRNRGHVSQSDLESFL